MDKIFSQLRFLMPIFLVLGLGSCGMLGGAGNDDESNIVSEIDEATEDISADEGGSADQELTSENESGDAQEDFQSEYEDSEAQGEVADNKDQKEEFSDDEFSDEELDSAANDNEETADGEEIAGADDENFEDFEEFDDETQPKPERDVAQNEEPVLEGLDDKSAQALNEPPEDSGASETDPNYPDATVENASDLASESAPVEELEANASDGENEGNNAEKPAALGWIPVKKIKSEPFYRNGRLLNTVYIVRTDTDLGSISKKIYGEDRRATLLEDNPHLANGAKTGDKVYYNSPSRPNDTSMMKVAYEDVGAVAQEYVTRAGDNIRTFSEKILGFPNAWKEVWATNFNVESKGEVEEGINLRYWRDDLGSLNTKLAGQAQPPGLDVAGTTATEDFNSGFNGDDGMAVPPPPPPEPHLNNNGSMAQNSTAPSMNTVMPPPDIPPVADIAPPPPPPPPEIPEKPSVATSGGGPIGGMMATDSTTLIYVALGLVAAVALFIKRKKSARAPSVFEATQV